MALVGRLTSRASGRSIWDFFGIGAPYERVLSERAMPGARWFEGARLNYAEHLLTGDDEAVAVVARSQTRGPIELTFGELREQVARARAGLQRLGVGPGDRVVGYLPNVPEALVAFIASASLGAIWASCAPEFGPRSVLSRIAQIEPKVLLSVAGYTYRDREVDRRAEVAAIREGLPTLEHVVHVPVRPARPARRDRLGGAARPRTARWNSSRSRSTTRSTCCSPRARPACRRRSCTATAGCSSSTSRPRGSAGTSSPATRAAPVHDDRLDDVERAGLGAAARARRS